MTTASCQSTDVRSLAEKLEGNPSIELIDVRTPAEYREVHAERARNIPLDSLDPNRVMESRPHQTDEPLYLICKTGGRSTKACNAFAKAGFENVVSVDGGTIAWEGAGLPVKRGQKTIALDRQVRITAGSLALLGAILGYFVDIRWIGLSAFIGAGLTWSGLSDTCAMGTVLARMPWNRA